MESIKEVQVENKNSQVRKITLSKEESPTLLKRKASLEEVSNTRTKRKHWVDVRTAPDACEKLNSLLKKCNEKEFGRPVTSGDIMAVLLEKITDKDIERIREMTLRPSDKLKIAHIEFVRKNNIDISYEEFLCKQLKLQ